MVGLYPSIPYSADLSALKPARENRKEKQIRTSNLCKMTEFVLGNNYFQFFDKVYQIQNIKLLLWLRYIDDLYFYGNMEKNSGKPCEIFFI